MSRPGLRALESRPTLSATLRTLRALAAGLRAAVRAFRRPYSNGL